MRPDEHKKKRSIQYKKKHGMSKDDKTNDSGQPKTKNTGKGKVKVDQKAEGKHFDSHVTGAAKLSHSSSDSDTSDNEQDSAPTSKTFSRREVVSNWARYEILPPDSETTPSRGEDFLNLLNTAGGTSSQFRFKEEEYWDEGESISTDAKLLAVDLTDLAASLQCIPLYHRLGVEQDLFSTEQIQEMESVAREHTQQYKPSSHAADLKQQYKPSSHAADLKQQYKPSSRSADHTQHPDHTVTDSELEDTGGTGTGPDLTKEHSNKREVDGRLAKTGTDCRGSIKVVSSHKDRSCSTGVSTCVDNTRAVRTPVINTHVNTNEKKTSGATSDNLEEDLAFLLSLDNPSDATGPGETTQQHSVQETVKTPPHKTGSTTPNTELKKETTENLEDWLDSVLD